MTTNNSKFAPQHKKPGDLILSDEWNAGMQETVRLESAKVNRQGGDSLQGPLTIESALAVDTTTITSIQLEVKGALKLADGVAVNQFSNDESLSNNRDTIVPTQKAVKTYVDRAVTTLNSAVQSVVVKGMILMWSGPVDQIPGGWALCDGNNNTPDLRGRFVLGNGQGTGLTNRRIHNTGGVEKYQLTLNEMPSHSHDINDPGHYHNWSASRQEAGTDDKNNTSELSKGDTGAGDTIRKDTNTVTTNITIKSQGGNQAHENMPPFYVLAYIIKL